MEKILGGLVLINGTDIWKEYGVFLTEEKKGGRENLNAILTPSKAKEHVGVDIREHAGRKYSRALVPANAERDITLHFAQYAGTREQWLANYMAFIPNRSLEIFRAKSYIIAGCSIVIASIY